MKFRMVDVFGILTPTMQLNLAQFLVFCGFQGPISSLFLARFLVSSFLFRLFSIELHLENEEMRVTGTVHEISDVYDFPMLKFSKRISQQCNSVYEPTSSPLLFQETNHDDAWLISTR